MNTSRLLEIAHSLASLIQARSELNLLINHLNVDLEARKLALVPAEGWPGKNEGERKLSADRVFAADKTCSDIHFALEERTIRLANVEAEIGGLEAERRALEWEIRAKLVEALAGKRDSADPEDAFDDALQAQADDFPF